MLNTLRLGWASALAGTALVACSGAAIATQATPKDGPQPKVQQEVNKKAAEPVELGDAVGREFRAAGSVPIDKRLTGSLSFTEHKNAYRVDITIPCKPTDQQLKGERFEVWLLGPDGRAMRQLERPPAGTLLMSSTGRSTCGQAIFVFGRDVPVKALAGIAVRVDRQLTIVPIPKK